MTRHPADVNKSWRRRIVHGLFGAAVGAAVGLVVAGERDASLAFGAALCAGIGFVIGLVVGVDGLAGLWWLR